MEGVGATGSVAGKLRVAVMNWTWLCSSPIDKQDGKRRERAETMEHHVSWVIVHLRVSTLMQNLDFIVFFLIDVKHANVYTLLKKKNFMIKLIDLLWNISSTNWSFILSP